MHVTDVAPPRTTPWYSMIDGPDMLEQHTASLSVSRSRLERKTHCDSRQAWACVRERMWPMVADGTDASRTWRRWADLTELFDPSSDPEWTADRDRVDHEVRPLGKWVRAWWQSDHHMRRFR
jgi:hypothetical protein